MSNNYLTGLAGVLASDVTRSLELDPVQEKINKLQDRTQEKLNRLDPFRTKQQNILGLDPSLYQPATLDIVTDADTMRIRGVDTSDRLGGDPTIPNEPVGWIDAPETYHGAYSNSPKEQARIAKQQEVLSARLGRPATTEDVFKAGETAKLNALYEAVRSEGDPEWTPGPIEYDVTDPLVLGSKEIPLNIPIQRYATGDSTATSGDRGVSYIKSQDGSGNVNAMLADPSVDMNTQAYTTSNRTAPVGSISKKYESGGDVSAIAPDSGGTTSYGTYQMNSAGTMQDFLKSPEGQVFSKPLSKYEVGSPEFNATYQKIAKSNSGRLAEAQDKYIQRTHFEPIAQMAQKAGINVQDPRVQEALWSQSVQHSPNGNAAILKSAIDMVGVDAKPEELVQAMYVSRNNYVQGLDTINDVTKAQLTDRYANEMNDVLNSAPVKELSTKEKLIAESEKRAAEGGLENAAKAFAYTLGEGIANTVDLVPEVASYVYGNIIGDQKWSETKGLYDKEESAAYKEWLGYNDTIINKLGKEAVIAVKDAWEKGDYGGLLDVMGEALTTPELLTHSLGYVAGMILPGGAATKALQLTSKVNKTANAIKAANAASKMTKAQALAIAEKDAGAGYKILKTITNNVGFAGEAEQFSRDAEALYKETYNEEMPIAQKLLIRPLGMLFAKTDALTAKAILLGKDPIARAVPEMIKALPDAVKINFAGKMAVLAGSTAAKAAGAFGLEGSTEAIQTAMEKVAGKYKAGEVGVGDVLGQEKYEIAGSGILGGVGGNQMQIAGAVPQMAMDAPGQLKKGIELATENEVQKQQRIDREFTSPKRKEALKAAIEGNPDGVITNASDIHGRLSDVIDSGASQRYTYRAILNDALNAAAKVGNPKAAENVYKTIAALDANPKVEFKAKDILDKEDNELVNKFLQLVNKPELSKTAKVVGVDAEDTMAEIAQLKAEADARKESRSRIFGSDIIGDDQDINEAISKLADDYMKAKGDGKALEAVNEEFARLGFIVKDGAGVKADPNRPGLKRYKDVLTDALIDSKKQNIQLDKKLDQVWGVPTLGKLKKFAESRVAKLGEGKRQNNTMMGPLVKENSQMIELANELDAVIDATVGITPENKTAYKELLNEVRTDAESANAEVTKRQAVIQQLVDAGVSQEAADRVMYDVAKDGTVTLQVSTGKIDGKWSTKKIADVSEDGKLTLVDDYKELIKSTNTVEEEVTQKTDKAVVSDKEEVKTQAQPEEVMTKDKLKEEYVTRVKKVIKEKAGKPEELTKEEEQLLANAAEDGILQQVNKELAEEVAAPQTKKEPAKVEGPLAEVRAKVAKLDKELADRLASVQDMEVKQHVKEHYNKKLTELQEDKSKLDDMLNRYEALIARRQDKTYNEKDGVVLSALKMTLDKLLTKMIDTARKLKNLLKGKSTEYNRLEAELKELLQMINEVEKPVERKTTIGKVKVVDEGVYGKPIVEVGDKRIIAEKISEKTGKDIKQTTAINQVLNKLAEDKIVELRDELKSVDKGKTSLGAKLVGRLLKNYPMQSPVHNILKRTNDSVFGQIKGNTFANTKLLLDTLPKGFKEFFAKGDGAKELLKDFEVMKNYINGTRIGDILISKDRRVYSTSSNKSNIDSRGLIKKTVISEDENGNVKESDFPVDIIELIGTVKDGKLEIDEQTQNILKFYSAKMLSDTQKMVGLILSMDESEMGQILSIYDADEQLQVKQDARRGYINSASVRGDIGKEVYQALGIKFNETTPEFTEESFVAALGILVQAIAVENGSMLMEKSTAGKNRNLIKTDWSMLPVERNELIRATAKLQYMNENRSRPLPSTKKPADRANREVMNTRNPIDKKSNEFINKQEKIAYTISPNLSKWLEMDEKDALKAMGYMEIETAGLHASEIDAVVARNDKLVREWNILKVFAEGIGNKPLYLNWGQTVSGRFTILNDINYQESKLHREFVVAEGSTIEVDPKSEDGRQMLEASILQGLDMDPDKLSAKTASENFNNLFKVSKEGIEVTPHKKDKDDNLDKTQVAIKQAYDAMKKGEFDADAMAEVFAESEGHHGLSAIELLVEWDKAIKDGTKIKTHANLEIDAITSGMILTLLQIGSNEAITLAEKGGIYTKEGKEARIEYVKDWLGDVEFTPGALIEAGKKHAAEIEVKMKTAKGAELVALRQELENDAVFKDLYSTIGVAMIDEVQTYKEKLLAKKDKKPQDIKELAMLEQIGELNLKNIRSIAKSPVMVFIYGATINSIKNKLTYSLGVDTLVKAMKTASKKLKAGGDVTSELEFIKQFEPKDGWAYTDGLGGKIDKPAEQWEQLLYTDITEEVVDSIGKVIRATFGTAIENAFENRLGFVNRNRDAVKTVEVLMFEAYQIRLSDAVTELLDSKYGKNRHNGELYKISKEELQDINAKLTDQGYGHNIVWYEDGGVVNQTLNKTGEKGGKNSVRVQVGDVKVGGQIKEAKPAVNTGAAPTISIHAIDGRMMLDVLNREVKGYTGGNVYDAVVLSLDKAMLNDTANIYNTNMIETGFSRSILVDQLTALENMLVTMSDSQKKRMLTSIGLRPESQLKKDYTNEVNRLKLGTGKMLELLEIAEEVNKERLANSANGYSVGHLFQMGAGVVDVEASETRAKTLPVIDTIKRLLEDRQEQDRKITEKEFGVRADYVFNTNDIIKGETQIESKANIAQISTGDWVKTTDPMWGSLSSKDIVTIIGEYILPEKADSKSRAYNKVISGILKSNAGILDGKLDKELLKKSGRQLINGVWVKTKAETKVEEGTLSAEQITKLKKIFMNDKGELKSGIAKLVKELKLDMKDC